MTTKEQERQALAKIRKIVEGLGNDSYIATAFEGCFEIAEYNIENDFSCSLKQRAESAEKKASTLELDNRDLRHAIKEIKANEVRQLSELNSELDKYKARALCPDDLTDCLALVDEKAGEAKRESDAAAHEIVAWADDPSGELFKQAVMNNRNAFRRYDYFNRLRSRIDNALNQF